MDTEEVKDAKIKKLEDALRFYADERNWIEAESVFANPEWDSLSKHYPFFEQYGSKPWMIAQSALKEVEK